MPVEPQQFIAIEAEKAAIRPHPEAPRAILREGSSADRQLGVFGKTNDLNAVVDDLIAQSSLGT